MSTVLALPITLPSPEKGAELFQTYGPFFVCIVLLSIAYGFAYLLYKRIEKNRNAEINAAFLKDFRLFYKVAIYGTLATAAIGLSWWLVTNIVGLSALQADHKKLSDEVVSLQKERDELQGENDRQALEIDQLKKPAILCTAALFRRASGK